jgi:SNF5 / SMARCB1 / INI1
VGDVEFQDDVEWDLNEPQNTPQAYVCQVCQDLGLNWEFARAILKSVEEQLSKERQVRKVGQAHD